MESSHGVVSAFSAVASLCLLLATVLAVLRVESPGVCKGSDGMSADPSEPVSILPLACQWSSGP